MKKIIQLFTILILSLFIASCTEINEIKNILEENQVTGNAALKECKTNSNIAGFNIQTFGIKKMQKPIAVKYIPRIISEFDIVAIQEIRDKSGTSIANLSKLLPIYNYTLSERLGRTSSKEQYGIFYRNYNLINQKVYPEPSDIFEREPFILYFENQEDKGENFSLIVIHVKPADAQNEINNLKEVINYAQESNNDKDFILLGDLNADCTYYNENQKTLREYYWPIDNSYDTTVGNSVCTYDRIITNMDYCDYGVYNFQKEFDLYNNESKIISDHYPVWIKI